MTQYHVDNEDGTLTFVDELGYVQVASLNDVVKLAVWLVKNQRALKQALRNHTEGVYGITRMHKSPNGKYMIGVGRPPKEDSNQEGLLVRVTVANYEQERDVQLGLERARREALKAPRPHGTLEALEARMGWEREPKQALPEIGEFSETWPQEIEDATVRDPQWWLSAKPYLNEVQGQRAEAI
jgi:hypothetical protein